MTEESDETEDTDEDTDEVVPKSGKRQLMPIEKLGC